MVLRVCKLPCKVLSLCRDLCRTHEMSDEAFHKEANSVLNFLQDKFEEYVEDNDIPGGDVEQGVSLLQPCCILSGHSALSAYLQAWVPTLLPSRPTTYGEARLKICICAARRGDSKIGTLRDLCVQQAGAKPSDMALITHQVRVFLLFEHHCQWSLAGCSLLHLCSPDMQYQPMRDTWRSLL